MHMLWLSITSSRMRNDYQYSNTLSYNTFPFPPITEAQKEELTQFNSNNTELLTVEQTKEKLLTLAYIRDEIKAWENR